MSMQQSLPLPKMEGVALNVHILPILPMSPQKPLLFQGAEEFAFLSAMLFPTQNQTETLPPCERMEKCYPGGCDMCNGQRSTLAQMLRPELPGIDPQDHFDLAA